MRRASRSDCPETARASTLTIPRRASFRRSAIPARFRAVPRVSSRRPFLARSRPHVRRGACRVTEFRTARGRIICFDRVPVVPPPGGEAFFGRPSGRRATRPRDVARFRLVAFQRPSLGSAPRSEEPGPARSSANNSESVDTTGFVNDSAAAAGRGHVSAQ